ncbi:hypothetical protein OUZ56_009690 [Daphnia magna]|uniref:Uncharacterized protein n=1 Tax=Daphnia magna TaxID=35525 RepID=A0ABR0AGQ6_9CRUS|nr:hypothetical protein OUZ56_009690 [Daphnia magna]
MVKLQKIVTIDRIPEYITKAKDKNTLELIDRLVEMIRIVGVVVESADHTSSARGSHQYSSLN